MNASVCIYMYCNIERKMMKNQSGSPSFGIQAKIYVYLFYVLAIVYFSSSRVCLHVIFVYGSMTYVMVCTRPYIAHAVGVLSKFMSKLGKEHWTTVKQIFRYLRGTSDYGLCYQGRP